MRHAALTYYTPAFPISSSLLTLEMVSLWSGFATIPTEISGRWFAIIPTETIGRWWTSKPSLVSKNEIQWKINSTKWTRLLEIHE